MITIIKNDFLRLWTKKSIIVTMLILTAGAIAAALFFSTRAEVAATIAITGAPDIIEIDSPLFKTVFLDEVPVTSEIVSGKYDAVVTYAADGTYEIISIKNEETTEAIEYLLTRGQLPDSWQMDTRGTGATIIGYLLMFILMESSMLMCMFAEDKEHKQLTRISAAPIHLFKYLAGHSLFNFICIFGPTLGILYIIKTIMGADIGFTLLQYIIILAVICIFGTALSLFLNSLFADGDTANMAGASLIVLTSVLSGTFYSFDKGNRILEAIVRFLPQKVCMNFVEVLENSSGIAKIMPYLIYLGIFMLVCISFAVIKTRREYIQSH